MIPYIKPIVAGTAVALVVGGALALPAPRAQDHAHHAESAQDGLLQIPEPMAVEHEALHKELQAAMSAGGKTGEAAREVEKHLTPHFQEENRVALPPLGVLRTLVSEGASEEMRPAIELARHVEENLDRFLREHETVKAAVETLEKAAEAEDKPQQAAFARKLRLHAQQEEEVLYPAAILIGRYLEQQLAPEREQP